VQFVEADCAVPRVDGEGGFDVVFGGWLLNYAAERRGGWMFRNIAVDLKDGGGFPWCDCSAGGGADCEFLEAEMRVRLGLEGLGGLCCWWLGDVEEGIFFKCMGDGVRGCGF